ncbi:MAG: hypothetical protein J7J17_00250 [Hadesarchaea archaeon]|nr:hypothetical protein [Hadesarchaea archaeon]
MPEEAKSTGPEPDEAAIRDKLSRVAQLLMFRRHRQPGAKSWELRKTLGRNYREIIDMFDREIQKIGLVVKRVTEGEEEDEDSARYYVTMKEHPVLSDRTFGWRIDDMAALTVALSYILSKRGKAPLNEVERVLQEKFPKWRVGYNIDRFIRWGYLSEDDEGMLYVGWRTRAEIDQKTLLEMLLGKEGGRRVGGRS